MIFVPPPGAARRQFWRAAAPEYQKYKSEGRKSTMRKERTPAMKQASKKGLKERLRCLLVDRRKGCEVTDNVRRSKMSALLVSIQSRRGPRASSDFGGRSSLGVSELIRMDSGCNHNLGT